MPICVPGVQAAVILWLCVCVCGFMQYCKLRVLCLTGIVVCVWGFVCVAVTLLVVCVYCTSFHQTAACLVVTLEYVYVCLSLLMCSNSCGPPWPCACVCEFIILDSICGPRCHCKLPVCSAVTL